MHVLCATDQTQGDAPDDYCWALEGELVRLPWLACPDARRCGCSRGFAGLATGHATTTASVVDHPALDQRTYLLLLAAEVADAGAAPRDALWRYVVLQWVHLAAVAARHPAGTIIVRADGQLAARRSNLER